MKRINVAFVILENELKNWNGGISYYKNILHYLIKEKWLSIIILTDSKKFISTKIIKKKKHLKINESYYFKKNNLLNLIRKIFIVLLKKDIILYFILISLNIRILSHRRLFKNKKIKSIGWIPDLQHKVLKKYFPKKHFFIREKYIRDELNKTDKVFVSSNQIKNEFRKFYNLNNKIISLRVPGIYTAKKRVIKYKEKYILFPSQFWVHKNHSYIIKTAEFLRKKNYYIKFILCGAIIDHKSKNYFQKIIEEIKKRKVEKYFKILGEINNTQLRKLQKKSLAMVNPSLYEGWSTINEEAKVLGKFIFLSNIKGHIEQNNHGGILFSYKKENDLSKKIIHFVNNNIYRKEKEIYLKNFKENQRIQSEMIETIKKVYMN